MTTALGAFNATGVILRMAPLGEADRFVTLLTRDRGKITCIAKHIRTIKSRRNPHTELMNRVKCQLWKSRHHTYLSQATAEERFHELKKELPSQSSGAFMIEATERLLPDEAPHPELYDTLNETLHLIDFAPEKHALFREAYLIKLLQNLGNITSFRSCGHCQKKLPSESAWLDREHSTLACQPCGSNNPHASRDVISLESLKLMNFLLQQPLKEIARLSASPRHIETIGEFGRVFLYKNLHHILRSEAALQLY